MKLTRNLLKMKNRPLVQVSVDDGSLLDVRVADLLTKYGLPGIFFWPVESPIMNKKAAMNIAGRFEIGCHTWNHRILTEIREPAELEWEISGARKHLQKQFNQPIYWFCYPRGRYNQDIVRMVEDAGFMAARKTTIGQISKNDPPYETQTAVHVYQRKEYGEKDWLQYAKDLFDPVKPTSVFHVWLHSDEVERDGNWERLEQLFTYIA